MESHPQSSAPRSTETATQFGELCVSCEYLESCSFKKSGNQPTLFCEEFHLSPTPVRVVKGPKTVISKAKMVTLYTGLCINCDHRESCVFLDAGAVAGASGSQSSGASSQRTLTVVIKFDENGFVRDFAYHTSRF